MHPPRSLRHMRIASHVELITLIVMLANVFTVHIKSSSSLMGPPAHAAPTCSSRSRPCASSRPLRPPRCWASFQGRRATRVATAR